MLFSCLSPNARWDMRQYSGSKLVELRYSLDPPQSSVMLPWKRSLSSAGTVLQSSAVILWDYMFLSNNREQ